MRGGQIGQTMHPKMLLSQEMGENATIVRKVAVVDVTSYLLPHPGHQKHGQFVIYLRC